MSNDLENQTTDQVKAEAPVDTGATGAETAEVSGVDAVTPVVKGRYKVSRKGMGGRKPKYDEALLKELFDLQQSGTSLLAECQRRGLPYVSINSAMKRVGLK